MKRMFYSSCMVVLCVSTAVSCSQDPNARGYEVITDMKYAPDYDAFQTNDNTRDGKTLQTLPEGTIPRGFTPYHYAKEEAERAGKELRNPLLPTPEILARGKKLYNTFCIVCHGPTGAGDGPVAGKYAKPRPFQSDYMMGLSAGRIFHAISRGTAIMPAYAPQIAQEDRWKIVHYLQKEIQHKPTDR